MLRISRLPASEKCTHPYAQPFVNFCFGTCKNLEGFSPYPPATIFKNQCKLNAQEARSTTVEQAASTSAEAPAVSIPPPFLFEARRQWSTDRHR